MNLIEKWFAEHPGESLEGDELERLKQSLIPVFGEEPTGLDEDDNMEDIPMNCRELEEKGTSETMISLAELEEKEKQLKNSELKKGIPTEQLAEPDYYAGNGLSPLEAFKKGLLSREETIGFIKGNIIKYVTRAGHKHNASEDMVKAIDYCGHLKRLYENEMRNGR